MLLFLIGTSSCQNPQKIGVATEEHVETIHIDVEKAQDLKLSNLLDSFKYVALESNDESLIGKIDKIFLSKSEIIIVDKSITQSIFIFSQTGKFLQKIKKIGKGPGEYQIIKDVLFDKEKKILEIYDSQSASLIKYNLEGSFLSHKKIKYNFSSFTKVDGHYIVSTNKMINKGAFGDDLDYRFLTIDTNGSKLIKPHFAYEKREKADNRSFELQYPLFKNGREIFMTKLFGDTVYHYSQHRFEPLFILNYGAQNLPYSSSNIPSDVAAELIYSKNDYAFGHTINGVTDNLLSLTYGFGDYALNQYWCLISKNTGNTYNFKSVTNDINPYKFNYPVTSINNRFISIIDYIDSHEINDVDKTDIAFRNFNETSNPVLMIYKLKKDYDTDI